MTNTALRAENSNSRTITFKSREHEKFYEEYLKKCRYQDVYHQALVYCLGIDRDTRNNVNRLINCETANLAKTIKASQKQIEDINKIKKAGKFNELPETLKEIAEVRINNPDMSLIELGKLLDKPIGKSGVNYRLKKIIELAK